jgi:hypothetical protein
MRQLVRKRMSWAKRGPNARGELGDEKKAQALFRSRLRHQVNPMIAATDGMLWDGNRTHWGWELEGRPDVEMDFIVTDEEVTPDRLAVLQANSALHREPLRDADFAVVLRDTLVSNPGMTRKQLAEEVFDIDPSLCTRYLSLFDSVPEVQDAAKAGNLGVSDWYAIQRSADQVAALNASLNGATRDDLERRVRKERVAGQPAVRASKTKICLCGGMTVTISGPEVSLDEAVDVLTEATKEAKKAREQSLDIRTFAAVMRDRAKAN